MICLKRVNPWRGMAVVELVQSKAPAPYAISCMMQGAGIIPVPSSLRSPSVLVPVPSTAVCLLHLLWDMPGIGWQTWVPQCP